MLIEKLCIFESFKGVEALKETINKTVTEIEGTVIPMDMTAFVEKTESYPPEYGIEVTGKTTTEEGYKCGTMWRIQIVIDNTGLRRNVFVNAIGTESIPVRAGIIRRDQVIRRLFDDE
ncbi:hypothetical protein SAMN02910353_02809 [Ruminococcus sp. YRD2003]|uniref:hypothetical protein n=1 Tax=Ruminococcus sp. YRD2003 TaxID=1452313 RepID=UPI0008B990FE|nr:hypothetical protein SAMN02910353_02809 [Ruminococcus flavefaciens]